MCDTSVNENFPFEKIPQYEYFSENPKMEDFSLYDIVDEDYGGTDDDYDFLYCDEENDSNPYAHYIAQRLALEAYVNEFNDSLVQMYGTSFLGPEDFLAIPEGMFAIEDIEPHMRECQRRVERKVRMPEIKNDALSHGVFDGSVELVHLSEGEANKSIHEKPLNEMSSTNNDESYYFTCRDHLSDDRLCSLDFVEPNCDLLAPLDDNCSHLPQEKCESLFEPTASSDPNGKIVVGCTPEPKGTICYLCCESPYLSINPTHRKYRDVLYESSIGKGDATISPQLTIISSALNGVHVNFCNITCNTISIHSDKSILETPIFFFLNELCDSFRRYASSVFIFKNYMSWRSRGIVPKEYKGSKTVRKKLAYGIISFLSWLSMAISKKKYSPKALLSRNIKLLADLSTLCYRGNHDKLSCGDKSVLFEQSQTDIGEWFRMTDADEFVLQQRIAYTKQGGTLKEKIGGLHYPTNMGVFVSP
ncbi:hypothetical protein RhiirA5_405894 [Rhizophagus irregularis]|uniref:Uncharacterized protein n=1 Tax=Rhizophagus irregularis TaxID=588596 RepID=A0A2N0QED9_9GLOM|nr:hypothetical protein RhiirA5_405894 [Rhizophagus irregularis]